TLKMINLPAGNSKSFFSKSLVYQGIKEYIGINFRAEIVTYVLKKEENRIFRVRKTIKKCPSIHFVDKGIFSFKNKNYSYLSASSFSLLSVFQTTYNIFSLRITHQSPIPQKHIFQNTFEVLP
ncbi:hypothetical protein P4H03_30065, partial [Bacillus cereus]|nr:hypothetical protein [Bacillus cereus]